MAAVAKEEVIPVVPQLPQQMLSIPTKVVMKHNAVPNRTFTHDGNTLIECISFPAMGKIQPFLISITTNVCFMIDFHSHLTLEEVNGYLAGHWDNNTHMLTITHAFPCCISQKKEGANYNERALEIGKKIRDEIDGNLKLVGWYHSHPLTAAMPTLRDIDAQLDYQIKLKGTSNQVQDINDYTPCVGIICSPYYVENPSLESSIVCYWVTPPPENKPYEYGRPMLMSYSVVQDAVITNAIMDEMKALVRYHKGELDFDQKLAEQLPLIAAIRNPSSTFLDKLKTTLSSKLPREQPDKIVWGFIGEILECKPTVSVDEKPTAISATHADYLPLLLGNAAATHDPNLVNALFPPSPSALLGLTDPVARATLAANNMFLPPASFFKMGDPLSMLKPPAEQKLAKTKDVTSSSSTSGSQQQKRSRSSATATATSTNTLPMPPSPLDLSSLMASPFLKPNSSKIPDYANLKSDILNQMLDMTTNVMKNPKFNTAMDLSNLINFTKLTANAPTSTGLTSSKSSSSSGRSKSGSDKSV